MPASWTRSSRRASSSSEARWKGTATCSTFEAQSVEAVHARLAEDNWTQDGKLETVSVEQWTVLLDGLTKGQTSAGPDEPHWVARVEPMRGCVLHLGETPYLEAWELQRTIAAEVKEGARPDTVIFLEHPPVVTLGRRTDDGELHVPDDAEVEVVQTDRGGKSTYHGPGQLVCYPILDLNRHGRDVRKYCRDLEEALIRTTATFGIDATRIDGLTGVWLERPPRKIASIGVHISRWVTTHGYALNVDLDPAPFTDWITACGLEDAAFTTMAREHGRPLAVDDVRPAAAAAIAEVFDLELQANQAVAAGPR